MQEFKQLLKKIIFYRFLNKKSALPIAQENRYALKYASNELKTQIGDEEPISKLKELIQIEQDKINLENKINSKENINKLMKVKI